MKTKGLESIGIKKNIKELMQAALGREKSDIVIINGSLLNVYTGEILNSHSVSVKGEWIVYVGKNPDDTIGPDTQVIDAKNQIMIPGFIDGHTHLAWLFDISEFLKCVIPGGTTTIVTETMEVYPVGGYEGVIDFIQSLKNQPIKIFSTAPSMVSISHTANGVEKKDLQRLLDLPNIIGLGESYWQAFIQNPDNLLSAYEKTLLTGKRLEGHSAGASEKKLNAYLTAGITSCHEPTTAEQVLDRLRLGLHVMIREGSIRRDLETISKISKKEVDLRRLVLVTDGIQPNDLISRGYMEYIVQKAINCGFDPITSIQMATLNVAEHFGLDPILGGIAPGRYADILLIPDLKEIKPRYVISKGQIIAKNGKIHATPRKHTFSPKSLNSIHLPGKIEPSDFIIPAKGQGETVNIRVIHQITALVTDEIHMERPVINGEIKTDVDSDVIKVAAIDRTHQPGRRFVGLIKGFGLQKGAFASSASWDTSDIIVAGVNDYDMALAVNRIHELNGGVVVCSGGNVLEEIPLPVFGIISDLSLNVLARQVKKINETIQSLGFPYPDPMLTIVTLTGAAIPYLRICEEGLVNLKNGKGLELFID